LHIIQPQESPERFRRQCGGLGGEKRPRYSLPEVKPPFEEGLGGQDSFVEIHLPVHEATSEDELFHGGQAFFLNSEVAVGGNGKGIDEPFGAHDALLHAGEETIPHEVI